MLKLNLNSDKKKKTKMAQNPKSLPISTQITTKFPVVHQKLKENVQPKLKEITSKYIKILAKWVLAKFCWKKFLMSLMVFLIASKMVLLMLTYQFFTMTSLLSLQIFHGVWTIAFFCLTVINTKSVLPNASCLLAGYLPATTVLHILLIPNDYPLQFIITDAVTTLLAIMTMFFLLKMECSQMLNEAEELWSQSQRSSPGSDAGTKSTDVSTRSSSPEINQHLSSKMVETVSSPQYQIGYPSMDEKDRRHINTSNLSYEEAYDLEPLDFEHFIDEPDLERNQVDKMFRVLYEE